MLLQILINSHLRPWLSSAVLGILVAMERVVRGWGVCVAALDDSSLIPHHLGGGEICGPQTRGDLGRVGS